MYACTYVCMYVCMYVCTYACMYVYVCMCVFVYVCMCVCVYVCMCVYMYIYIYAYVYVYVYVYVHVYVCVCVCVYIYIYIYSRLHPRLRLATCRRASPNLKALSKDNLSREIGRTQPDFTKAAASPGAPGMNQNFEPYLVHLIFAP